MAGSLGFGKYTKFIYRYPNPFKFKKYFKSGAPLNAVKRMCELRNGQRTHLPRDPRGEVFDDHAIVGSRRRSVLVDPGAAAAAPAIATARSASVLHGNPKDG